MHSVPSVRTYVLVWLTLTIMTGVTFYVSKIEMGEWNIVVALLISPYCLVGWDTGGEAWTP